MVHKVTVTMSIGGGFELAFGNRGTGIIGLFE